MQSYNGDAYVCGTMSKNNFSDQPILSVGLSPQAIRAACWRHYRRHWWRGLLLGMVAVWLPFLPDLLHYARMGFPLKISGSDGFAGGMIIWEIMLVCFAGVPSAVAACCGSPGCGGWAATPAAGGT